MCRRGIAGAALTSCEIFSSRLMRATKAAARVSGEVRSAEAALVAKPKCNASNRLHVAMALCGSRHGGDFAARSDRSHGRCHRGSHRCSGRRTKPITRNQHVEILLSQRKLRLCVVGAVDYIAKGSVLGPIL